MAADSSRETVVINQIVTSWESCLGRRSGAGLTEPLGNLG